MIIYQSRIYRRDLRANPNVLYVFGDNLERVGFGGQAAEMRGEPNAVGVATKNAPGMNDDDFFSDDEFQRNIVIISTDFDRARAQHRRGDLVVVPADGIGTGLSEMPLRAPRTFEFLCSLKLGGWGV